MTAEGFYLGGVVDPATGDKTGEPIDYDSANLTTHGVIVGMTGSGKTGLGIIFLEEALRASVPTLIIDPKGDMTNLLLTFPDLKPEDFEPWVDPGEAAREGKSAAEMAAAVAELWKGGLESWDLGPADIGALRDQAAFTIYTPGSEAGVPVNIVGSLAAPDLAWEDNAEALADEIEGYVSGLLGLAGIAADPLSSKEHILLSNLIAHAWQQGSDLDLATLIGQVQQPPIRKLGVFDVDSFFPEKERAELAMKLNGLVASPSFTAWLRGSPLDVERLLYDDGKPRAAVVYLAHLSEEERQFVVTLVLSKMVTWMRAQAGSGELRALVYMDEVFGYVPPTAQPPPKKPILTLLKQARAFGVGLLLSTQNPVDLDYKAMSNAGTWCVGRLQTERDKARILEGLQSARGDVDVASLDATISGLDKRQFLLHTTKADAPSIFTTRWAMSYLRGPLTKDQVADLTEGAPERQAAAEEQAVAEPAAPLAHDETTMAPAVHSSVPVYWLDPAAPWAAEIGAEAGSRYAAALAARVHLLYDDTKAGVDHREEWEAVFHPLEERFDPATATVVDYDDRDFRGDPPEGATYVLPEVDLDKSAFFTGAKSALRDHLYRQLTVSVHKNPALKMYSRVGESREEFAARCDEAAEQMADAEVAKMRDKLEAKMRRIEDQVQAAELRLQELSTDVQARRQEEMLDGVGSLLGGLLGGRRSTRSLSRAMSKRSQTKRTEQRKATAEAKLADKVAELEDLEAEAVAEVAGIHDTWEEKAGEIEDVEIGLEKTDIDVAEIAVVWVPTG